MKKWKIVAPLALTAAGALAAGIAVLMKKPEGGKAPAASADKGKAKPAAAPKNLFRGSYSFISGFKDAVTVEASLEYDADRYSFSVLDDEFPSESSDSHVAVIWGEDFNMQLEYAGYFGGEGFEAHSRAAAEKFTGFGTVRYGAVEGLKYVDGDNMVLNLRIPGDEFSYLLVTLMKAPGNDEDYTTLPDHPDVKAMLGSLTFDIKG